MIDDKVRRALDVVATTTGSSAVCDVCGIGVMVSGGPSPHTIHTCIDNLRILREVAENKATVLLGEMRKSAERVGRVKHETDEAYQHKKFAEAELLEEVVKAIAPALSTFVSLVESDMTTTLINTPEARFVQNEFPWRGLHVAGIGVTADDPRREPAGMYGGAKLYLDEHANFVLVTYVGEWTNAKGGTRWWIGTDGSNEERAKQLDDVEGVVPPTFRVLTPREAVESYKVEVILESIAAELSAQFRGNGEKRGKEALARAKKICAIVELLK